MSSMAFSAWKADYDAALALLDLRNGFNGVMRIDTSSEDSSKTPPKLLLKCIIASDVESTSKVCDIDLSNRDSAAILEQIGINSARVLNDISKSIALTTYCNAETQTDEKDEQMKENDEAKVRAMEATIEKLYKEVQFLSRQLKEAGPSQRSSGTSCSMDESLQTSEETDSDDDGDDDNGEEANQHLPAETVPQPSTIKTEVPSETAGSSTDNANSSTVVTIGEGHAKIPARLLQTINWNSYTNATRKLLSSIFTRRVLATHSLTGKRSPAFPNKPAKKKLNPALVNDIVQTVVDKCQVPENVVRTSITTKCADESKMFRMRQKRIKKMKNIKNEENIPPEETDSE